jgi:hypothetical protein
MIFIPLILLALAAGVFLLVTVESKALGRLYKSLAWLVIVLSLLFLAGGVVRGVVHHHRMAQRFHERGQFFNRGRHEFRPHHGWGHYGFDWRDKQDVSSDSTGTK